MNQSPTSAPSHPLPVARLVAAASLLLLLLVPVAASARAAAGKTGGPPTLTPGGSAFWDGGYVQNSQTHLPGAVACEAVECFSYPLVVKAGGWRLRVALDTPDRSTQFELDLIDPSGTQQASVNNPLGTQFDMEAFALSPAAGTWTVRVVPQEARNAAFRLRAMLESGPTTYRHTTVLPPDLMMTPPYEFTFVAPANPANAFATDDVNPPLDVAGQHPLSCTPDETANDGATRCLRFTTGPRNAGPGPFQIDYDPVAAQLGIETPGPAYQRIYSSDGTSTTRPAGEFQFHVTHGHYHYLDILQYELYSVGAHHQLTPAGSGKKLGFCPADELFADWHTFNQEQSKTFSPNCGYTVGGASLGLNIGWGDVYRWQRPGQYVDFSGNGDGNYVLQVIVDPKNHVQEASEKNNVGYAYIHVVGERVTILERGQGTSPWDAAKVVFTDQ